MDKREVERREVPKKSGMDWAKQQGKGEATCVKLPHKVEWYKLEVGRQIVDFMPFIAHVGNPRADEGWQHFEREYESHKIPLPNGQDGTYACLWKTFKKKCPVCMYMNKHSSPDNKDLISKMKSKTRHLWLVNDKPGDKDILSGNKEIVWKVLDSNHYNKKKGFGEQIAKAIIDDPYFADFWSLEGGYQAKMSIEEDSFMGRKYNLMTRIDFVKRDYDYPKDLIYKAPCLDDMLIPARPEKLKDKPYWEFDEEDWEACYEELDRILTQGGVSSEDADEPPVPERQEPRREERVGSNSRREEPKQVPSRKVELEDEDDTEETPPPKKQKEEQQIKVHPAEKKGFQKGKLNWVEYDGVKCEITKYNQDGSVDLEDEEDGKTFKGVSVDDIVTWKEAVKKSPVKEEESKVKSSSKKQVDPDEDDDMDDDEEVYTPKSTDKAEPPVKKRVLQEDDEDEPFPQQKKPSPKKQVQDEDDDVDPDD